MVHHHTNSKVAFISENNKSILWPIFKNQNYLCTLAFEADVPLSSEKIFQLLDIFIEISALSTDPHKTTFDFDTFAQDIFYQRESVDTSRVFPIWNHKDIEWPLFSTSTNTNLAQPVFLDSRHKKSPVDCIATAIHTKLKRRVFARWEDFFEHEDNFQQDSWGQTSIYIKNIESITCPEEQDLILDLADMEEAPLFISSSSLDYKNLLEEELLPKDFLKGMSKNYIKVREEAPHPPLKELSRKYFNLFLENTFYHS